MLQLNEEEGLLYERKRKLENENDRAFEAGAKRKLTIRQKTPSALDPKNSEKLQSPASSRSSRRRREETVYACKKIHGEARKGTYHYTWKMIDMQNLACIKLIELYFFTLL